jgi:hypothetical protein
MGLALLVWGDVRHHEIHAVQLAALHRRVRHCHVPAMHWIKCAAKESNIHAGFNPA